MLKRLRKQVFWNFFLFRTFAAGIKRPAFNSPVPVMKKIILYLLLALPLSLPAQQAVLRPATGTALTKERLTALFNTDKVHLEEAIFQPSGKRIFVSYEKTDTLDFNHPFYKNNQFSQGYISVGLACYELQGTAYRLLFANAHAFFCADCNNMHGHAADIEGDTVILSITWGPNAFSTYEEHRFVYRPELKRWRAFSSREAGSDDMGEERRVYRLYGSDTPYFLDNCNTEEMGFSKDRQGDRSVSLNYYPAKYQGLLKELNSIPAKDYDLLAKAFSADDARMFTADVSGDQYAENGINIKNMVTANNIGYFLEQANALAPAAVFLQKVIEKFPDREVAYFNLGDLFLKKKDARAAAVNYNTYINLMKERKLEQKIPKRVTDFVAANQRYLTN